MTYGDEIGELIAAVVAGTEIASDDISNIPVPSLNESDTSNSFESNPDIKEIPDSPAIKRNTIAVIVFYSQLDLRITKGMQASDLQIYLNERTSNRTS